MVLLQHRVVEHTPRARRDYFNGPGGSAPNEVTQATDYESGHVHRTANWVVSGDARPTHAHPVPHADRVLDEILAMTFKRRDVLTRGHGTSLPDQALCMCRAERLMGGGARQAQGMGAAASLAEPPHVHV